MRDRAQGRCGGRALAAALGVVCAWPAAGAAPVLEFSERPKLVSCDPVTTAPCFRVKMNLVDAQGAPAAMELPAEERLREAASIVMEGQPAKPFFAHTDSSRGRLMRPRIAMLVIDVSGSMTAAVASGGTRFDAAKAAAVRFLDGFENGLDRVAIVPFASRQVESTIRAARFVQTKEEARAQIEQLPAPEPRGNTALYSAVKTSIERMSEEIRQAQGSPEVMLMVMTDGKNDVRPGDDAGLLTGEAGLAHGEEAVRTCGFPVIGIGFGTAATIDEAAMKRLSTQAHLVDDPVQLTRLFTVARTLLNNRITLTYESPFGDRASLAGRTFHIQVMVDLGGGQKLYSREQTWTPPQIGTPLFEGKCDEGERRAMLALLRKKGPERASTISVVRPILVFSGFGAMIALLWLLAPRWIWPERYESNEMAGYRWDAGQTQNVAKAPPGFERGRGPASSRQATDKTVFMQKPGYDPDKTRLS